MKHQITTSTLAFPLCTFALLCVAPTANAQASDPASGGKVAQGAALVGGALPGGAIVSARAVTLTPVAGGAIVTVAIAGDGSFKATGLKAGSYRLALSSGAGKQTQGATFGEKVNAGLASAGSAVAQGASAPVHDATQNPAGNARTPATTAASSAAAPGSQTAKSGINGINGGMPNRISMNVTVARQTRPAEVDGAPIDVEVAADGVLVGRVAPQ